MKIGIHGKEFDRQSSPIIESIFDSLSKRKVVIHVSKRFEKFLRSAAFSKFNWKTFELGDRLNGLDSFISIGGDGTLLDAITYVGKSQTPVLGVNTGRLGFLATISKEEISDALEKLLDKSYELDDRTLLKLDSNQKIFENRNFALNDFTIVKKDSSSMIKVHTYIDGEFLNSYWSDGIIISTPTGSTGYSLSCGGPLVFPRSNNFVITPVSPHNLTVRPIIVSDNAEISFRVEGRSKKFLVSLDSRFEVVDESIRLKVKKADFKVNLIQLEGMQYFKTLRHKLNWGLDIRN
jgi:NAD+ kinase